MDTTNSPKGKGAPSLAQLQPTVAPAAAEEPTKPTGKVAAVRSKWGSALRKSQSLLAQRSGPQVWAACGFASVAASLLMQESLSRLT